VAGTRSTPAGAETESLQGLQIHVGAWVKAQKSRVRDAYLVPEREGIRLYVIGRSEVFDYELSRELSEFSISLLGEGMDLNTTLLPASSPGELLAFFDPERDTAIGVPVE